MKKLSEILEGKLQGIGRNDPGTARALALHPVNKVKYPAGSPEADDKLFNASNMGRAVPDGKDDRHGHVPVPKDEQKYSAHNSGRTAELRSEAVDASMADRKSALRIAKRGDLITPYMRADNAKLAADAQSDMRKMDMAKLTKAKHPADRRNLRDWIKKSDKTIDSLRKTQSLASAASRVVAKEEVDVDVDMEVVEAVMETHGYGLNPVYDGGSPSDELRSTDHHTDRYNFLMGKHRENRACSMAHDNMLGNKNAPKDLRKFHSDCRDAHDLMADAYMKMAEREMGMLNQAHSNEIKAQKQKKAGK